jgi:hypothetical protein
MLIYPIRITFKFDAAKNVANCFACEQTYSSGEWTLRTNEKNLVVWGISYSNFFTKVGNIR